MTMPRNLVLVRHGESEGNAANHRSKRSDHSDFTEEFKKRHSSTWRLTDLGREQAITAGVWIKENIAEKFGRYYVSEYLRAKETASLLNFPEAKWFVEFYLRERDWGNLDVMSVDDRERDYPDIMARREIDGFYWKSHSGESMADLCLRMERPTDTLHRECSEMDVLMVAHGEVIWAEIIRLLRLPLHEYAKLEASKDQRDRIQNCQIVHFTRINPEDPADVQPRLMWWRSVCPWDTSLSRNDWQPIIRPTFTNADLAAEVARQKLMIAK